MLEISSSHFHTTLTKIYNRLHQLQDPFLFLIYMTDTINDLSFLTELERKIFTKIYLENKLFKDVESELDIKITTRRNVLKVVENKIREKYKKELEELSNEDGQINNFRKELKNVFRS